MDFGGIVKVNNRNEWMNELRVFKFKSYEDGVIYNLQLFLSSRI